MAKAYNTFSLQTQSSRTVKLWRDLLDTASSSSSSLYHSHKFIGIDALLQNTAMHCYHSMLQLLSTFQPPYVTMACMSLNAPKPDDRGICGQTTPLIVNTTQYLSWNTKRRVFVSSPTSLVAIAGLLTQVLLWSFREILFVNPAQLLYIFPVLYWII